MVDVDMLFSSESSSRALRQREFHDIEDSGELGEYEEDIDGDE